MTGTNSGTAAHMPPERSSGGTQVNPRKPQVCRFYATRKGRSLVMLSGLCYASCADSQQDAEQERLARSSTLRD